MLLAINIGNTNITCGVFRDSEILESWKISKNKIYDVETRLTYHNDIKGVILASVVPETTHPVINMLSKLNFPNPLIVSSKLSLPITIDINRPHEVGADLIANMAAASGLKKPVIVLDSGTATTFCVLSETGEFVGAVIAPGLESMAKSLSENAALLPGIKIIKPENLVGRNTIESMQSGIFYGYVSLVNGMLEMLRKEFKESVIIATGGNIGTIEPDIVNLDQIDENLTLNGLKIIYELNKQ